MSTHARARTHASTDPNPPIDGTRPPSAPNERTHLIHRRLRRLSNAPAKLQAQHANEAGGDVIKLLVYYQKRRTELAQVAGVAGSAVAGKPIDAVDARPVMAARSVRAVVNI
jgi:hypothetical protein